MTTFVGDTPDTPADRMPKHLSKIEFARRLKKYMDAKRWKQADLARHANITRDAVHTYYTAKSLPHATNLQKIARALNVDPEDLLPNMIQQSMDLSDPPFSMTAASADGSKSWLKVNRLVKTSTAAQVLNLLNDDKVEDE